uniref:Uncharacterized protein n=1 Tax=Rhizophora mucronata TaxID=61149 RepID=A0A2P2P5I7_RHIMU
MSLVIAPDARANEMYKRSEQNTKVISSLKVEGGKE